MNDIKIVTSDDMLMEQVEQALRMTPRQRFLAGAELFDAACRFSLAGIRSSFPAASDQECRQRLRQRLVWAEELEGVARP
jgi:hypothetical protein